MRNPDYNELRLESDDSGSQVQSFAESVHPNPYFFKYYWWVFWQGSVCDGPEFLDARYRLPIATARQLIEKLRQDNEPCWIYNQSLPRRDPLHTPWAPESPKWEGVEWAPAYVDDPDPVCDGFK